MNDLPVQAGDNGWSQFDGAAEAWDQPLGALPGSNFYQCHAWGEVKRRLGWEVLRLAHPQARAQVLIRRYPFGLVLAWIPGGAAGLPQMWAGPLTDMIRRITNAGMLYVRINGLSACDEAGRQQLLATRWQRPAARLERGLSLRCDLLASESQRLLRASGNWRHNLKRSHNHGLSVTHWDQPDVAVMRRIYQEMEALKGLPAQVNDEMLSAQVNLLTRHLIVMRCDDREGRPIALRAAAVFGDTAWDFLAAATPAARKVYASHATLWALQSACAARGAVCYDMGGVDPEGNKGVFDFKRGVGTELFEYLGEWEWASNPLVRFAANAAIRRRGAFA